MIDTVIRKENVSLDALDIFNTGATAILTDDNNTNDLKDNSIGKILNTVTETVVEKTDDDVEPKNTEAKPAQTTKEASNVLDTVTEQIFKADDDENTEEVIEGKKPEGQGRPRTNKDSLVSYLKSKVEANEFGIPETVDLTKQTLDQYLISLPEKELHSLLDTNRTNERETILETIRGEFFEALPPELQYVAEFAANNGTDYKGLFKALSHVEEVRALDPENENDQVSIVRSYLQATKWPDVDNQVEEWKDAGLIEKKAKTFKPKLDEMQLEQVTAYNKQAAEQQKRDTELRDFYYSNVDAVLKKGEIAGVKLGKTAINKMYEDLTTIRPAPYTGNPVNAIQYALEEIQFTKPNYELLAEVNFLLTDPEGYKKAVRQQGANEQAEKTVKLIKMNQGIAATGTQNTPVEEPKYRRIKSNDADLRRKTA